MKTWDVIVIGGGAAGLMAAGRASERGAKVLLLEKNEKVGRKIGITGKGRCNVTNDCDIRTFLDHVVVNPRFLYSALSQWTPQDTMALLTENGVPLKVERGRRVFPVSDRSFDVIDGLLRFVKKSGTRVECGTRVTQIQPLEPDRQEVAVQDMTTGITEADGEKTAAASSAHKEASVNSTEQKQGIPRYAVKTEKGTYLAHSIILATGGLSYPTTGSTGDGFAWMEGMGKRVLPGVPALIPLTAQESWCRDLMGLTLKNVGVTYTLGTNGKKIYQDFGEMLFTHFGISGPTVLSASSFLQRFLREKKLTFDTADIVLHINLKSALSEETLEERLKRDMDQHRLKTMRGALEDLLPQRLIPVVLHVSQVDQNRKAAELKKEERKRLLRTLKDLPLHITGTRPIEEATVTQGGLSVKEVDPSTMEVRGIPGLYVAGELLDVDAETGGYNLQIAFATGNLAARFAARNLDKTTSKAL